MANLESYLDSLNQISCRKLGDILTGIQGKKDLIIDNVLMKPLECITGVSFLRSNGVDKIFKLDKTCMTSNNTRSNNTWVYLVYSDLITAKRVCDQINADMCNTQQNVYHIIIVPVDLVAIRQLLEEEGIYGSVKVHIFSWELIKLDTKVLSLELPSFFKMLFVDGDRSLLSSAARSIWSLQLLFGRIPMTITQGKFSQEVYAMTNILFEELGSPDKTDSKISCMLIVDRDVDYASVLLTPVTYVGLLDEVFGINSGTIELDSKVTGAKDSAGSKVNYQLSSTDAIYSDIKNRHFSDVFPFLSSEAKRLQSEYDRSRNMVLQEMKDYVKTKLQQVKALKRSLAYHIGACEIIIEKLGHKFETLHKVEQNMLEGKNKRENLNYIEECFAISGKVASLRLLCLMALTMDSLSQDDTLSLKSQFLHCYGYEHLIAFRNLEKLGLLTRQNIGSNFINSSTPAGSDTAGKFAGRMVQVVSQLPKRSGAFQAFAHKLKLFPEITEAYDLKQPKDPSYVFGGSYVPAVCQLVNLLIKKELSPDEIIKLGSTIGSVNLTSEQPQHKLTTQTFLVYYVGGVTYTEIAAFQLIEKLTGVNIIVAGTSIINGNSFVQSMI